MVNPDEIVEKHGADALRLFEGCSWDPLANSCPTTMREWWGCDDSWKVMLLPERIVDKESVVVVRELHRTIRRSARISKRCATTRPCHS